MNWTSFIETAWKFLAKNRLYIVLFAALTFMTSADLWGLTAFTKVRESAEWRAHTFEALQKIESVNTMFSKAESSERGYIITGKQLYLDDLEAIKKALFAMLDDLRNFLKDNPTQVEYLDSMKAPIAARIKELDDTIVVRKTQGLDATAKLIESRDFNLQHKILVIQADMEKEERRLLEVRTDTLNRDLNTIIWVNVGASVIGVSIVILVFLVVIRQASALQTANATLEQYKKLFNMSWDLVCISDEERFITVNSSFSRILGYTTEEMLNTPFVEFVHPDDKERTKEEAKKLTGGSITVNFINRYRTKSGEYRWINWTAVPAGNIVYAIGRDDTDRRILEDKLLATNQELSQFAYVASHDLKAPLRGINNLATWIQEDLKDTLNEDTKKHLQQMQERIASMNALIEGILQFSRIGRLYITREKTDLSALVTSVLDGIDKKKFVFDVAPLPTVVGNTTTLTQLFTNLLDNAVKHHSRDDGHVQVTFRDVDSFYEFSVQDDGPGIAKDQQHKLFVMFSTLDKKGGTGMGLALCKKIVEEVGGRIWVESDTGKGARFSFTWPKYLDERKEV